MFSFNNNKLYCHTDIFHVFDQNIVTYKKYLRLFRCLLPPPIIVDCRNSKLVVIELTLIIMKIRVVINEG